MCRPSVHSTASYHFSSHNPPESIVAYLLVQSTNNTKSTKQIRRSITQQQTDKVSQSHTCLLVLLIPCRGREEAMYHWVRGRIHLTHEAHHTTLFGQLHLATAMQLTECQLKIESLNQPMRTSRMNWCCYVQSTWVYHAWKLSWQVEIMGLIGRDTALADVGNQSIVEISSRAKQSFEWWWWWCNLDADSLRRNTNLRCIEGLIVSHKQGMGRFAPSSFWPTLLMALSMKRPMTMISIQNWTEELSCSVSE